MGDGRWHDVERLFLEASKLAEPERSFLLGKADPDLAAEVRALLEVEQDANAFFTRPPGGIELAQIFDPQDSTSTESGDPERNDDLATGTTVGPYRVVEEVGRGGMGTVYLAARTDGAFEKLVALKVVRRGLDTGDVLQRFARERRLLASLDHPNIARLVDGGSTEDGRPWLALEYVSEGRPITAWADDRHLNVDARLALFLQVCDAVAFAHHRLVVHRDLKPSNILVTTDGSVKLLDFGIARLLDEDQEDGSPLTRTVQRVLTPSYASPEQLRGETLTTAADVYGLGVVLFEQLAGRRPPVMPAERPSTAVAAAPDIASQRQSTPGQLQRRLRGDLDRITLKALHPEAERRYSSAEALGDDIRRYLDGLPVRARPDSPVYRASKFVRRNRIAVGGTFALIVLLLGFAVATTYQHRETARERDRAEHVALFLRTILSGANAMEHGRGDVTVADMLGAATRHVDREIPHLPDVQAELLLTIGEAYAGLGQFHEALPVLERALSLLRAHRPGVHVDKERALRRLAVIQMEHGNIAEAAALHRESLEMHRAINNGIAAEAIESIVGLGWAELQLANYDEAERVLWEAIHVGRALPQDSAVVIATTRGLSALGVVLMRRGDYVQAQRLEREALATRQELLGPDHPFVALSLSNLAKVIEDGGGPLDEALFLTERALTIRIAVGGDSSLAVLTTRSNLSAILRGLGRHGEAIEQAQVATSIAHSLFGASHTATAYARYNLAVALHAGRYPAEAASTYAQALNDHVAIWGIDHPYTAYVLVPYAKLLIERGLPQRAERLVRHAVEARRKALAESNWLTADAEATLGRALLAQGKADDAVPLLEAAGTALQRTRGPEACATRQAVTALTAAREGLLTAPAIECV